MTMAATVETSILGKGAAKEENVSRNEFAGKSFSVGQHS